MAKSGKGHNGISFSQLQAQLAKAIKQVYLIQGQDEFIVSEAANAIFEAAAKTGSSHMTKLDGASASLAEVLDSARTQDLFSPFKVVIVSDADKLLEKHGRQLATYAEKPAKNACLILLAEKIDGRSKLVKFLEESHGLVMCGRIYENEIPAWIATRAKASGCAIDREAAQLLADFIGEDLATIASEIHKLAAHAAGSERITVHDVEAVSLRDRMQDIFKLTDAIGTRQITQILPILNTLLERGDRPTGILFMAAKHIRQLWAIHELTLKGMNRREAALKIMHNNYVANKCLAQLDGFTISDLRRSTAILLEAEGALKSSQQDDQILLEMAFIKLAQPRRKSSARASSSD